MKEYCPRCSMSVMEIHLFKMKKVLECPHCGFRKPLEVSTTEPKTKIKNLTIVNQQGTKCFIVGNVYNGFLLHEIVDNSLEYPDSITIIYVGKSKSGDIIFEAINAPVVVEYEIK